MKDLRPKVPLIFVVCLSYLAAGRLAQAQASPDTPATTATPAASAPADPKKCLAAITAATHALAHANDLRGTANAIALRITGLAESQDSAASVLRDITAAIRELDLHGLPKVLREAQVDLNSQSQSMTQACSFSGDATSKEIENAKTEADAQTKRTSDALSGLTDTQKTLNDALTKAVSFATAGAAGLKDKVAELDKMADGSAEADVVESTLAKGLPVFADIVDQRKEYGEQWGRMSQLTAIKGMQKSESGDSSAADPVTPKLHELDTSIEKIEGKLPDWIGTLRSKATPNRTL